MEDDEIDEEEETLEQYQARIEYEMWESNQ